MEPELEVEDNQIEPLAPSDPNDSNKPAPFNYVTENEYITERIRSREGKRNKRMMCDCNFDPEIDDSSDACGENCLNRLLMIECGSRCPCGEYCNNKRFQRACYKPVEVFKTQLKGWGLRSIGDIKKDSFVMEYCGEVCTPEEFELRRRIYEQNKRRHYYFMSLKTDEIIDATKKGNLSRYINHSCDPNCETQKWTVNGRLRVGFFAIRNVGSCEELTFDYQFQRFGEAAQLCYCGSDKCRGFLGVNKDPPKDMMTNEGKTKRSKTRLDSDCIFEREVYDIVGGTWCLKTEKQVLSLSRLMLQAENYKQRTMILKVIQSTVDIGPLRRFLSLHGLGLIWSWMIELSDNSNKEILEMKQDILQTLDHLPIPNKNIINDSKILQVIMKWSIPSVKKEDSQIVISEADCSGVVGNDLHNTMMELEAESKAVNIEAESKAVNIETESMVEHIEESKIELIDETKVEHIEAESKVEGIEAESVFELIEAEAKVGHIETESMVEHIEESKVELIDETKVKHIEAESKVEHIETESMVEHIEESKIELIDETKVEHIEAESKVGHIEAESMVEHIEESKIELIDETKVEHIEAESKVGHIEAESMVEHIEAESRVEHIEAESKVEHIEAESKVGHIDVKPKVELLEAESIDFKPVVVESKTESIIAAEILLTNTIVVGSIETESPKAVKLFETESIKAESTFCTVENDKETGGCHEDNVGTSLSMEVSCVQEEANNDITINGSCEAEAIQQTNDKVLESSLAEDVMSLCVSLINKWDQLEEIFKIPKKITKSIPVNEKKRESPFINEDNDIVSSKKLKRTSRWDSPKEHIIRINDTTMRKESPATPINYQPPFFSVTTRPSLMGPSPVPPLHNSVTIVQPTGQSIYVQQQIFTPSSYVPPVTMTTSVAPLPLPLPNLPSIPAPVSPLFPHFSTVAMQPNHTLSYTQPPLLPPPHAAVNQLPPNWKQAKDLSGKVYYYHVVTRKTQWDPPVSIDSGDIMMDLETTPDNSPINKQINTSSPDCSPVGDPHTPEESPPFSPQNQLLSPSVSNRHHQHQQQPNNNNKLSKSKDNANRDHFKHSLSKLIVRCLDQHRRVDCKYGRITCAEDFKHLARKLTFGLTEKELNRKGVSTSQLVFTDSVKSRVKDYIKSYMKKFGPVYKRPAR